MRYSSPEEDLTGKFEISLSKRKHFLFPVRQRYSLFIPSAQSTMLPTSVTKAVSMPLNIATRVKWSPGITAKYLNGISSETKGPGITTCSRIYHDICYDSSSLPSTWFPNEFPPIVSPDETPGGNTIPKPTSLLFSWSINKPPLNFSPGRGIPNSPSSVVIALEKCVFDVRASLRDFWNHCTSMISIAI